MTRSLLVGGLCFVCGIVVGRLAHQASPSNVLGEKAQETKTSATAATVPCSSRPTQSATSSSGASEITISNQFSKSANIAVNQPRTVAVQVLDADTEAKTLELINAPFPTVKGVYQKQAPDGSVEVYGKGEDGTIHVPAKTSTAPTTKPVN